MDNFSDWLATVTAEPELGPEDKIEALPGKLGLLKDVLPALDHRDRFFYRKTSDDGRAMINKDMWIIMRWMTSPDNDKELVNYLLSVNDFVNNNFSLLSPKKNLGKTGHHELQWMLLSLCGTGKVPRRKFMKPPRGTLKNKLEEELLKFYPSLRDSELDLLQKINTTADLKLFFKDNGYEDKVIKELFKNEE